MPASITAISAKSLRCAFNGQSLGSGLTVGALAAAGPSHHRVNKSIPQLATRNVVQLGTLASRAPSATSAC